jgi:hypothetical protein
MTPITKKQASITLLVAVFAAIMITGTIAASSDNAYATHKKSHTHQSIGQKCKQSQHSTTLSSGPASPIGLSGNNIVPCLNLNLAGNAAAHDQSGNR